jgi:hypothetical protein
MKIGDLVKHMFEGRWDEVGLVIDIKNNAVYGSMVRVLWNVEHTHSNRRRYRSRDLQVINESR